MVWGTPQCEGVCGGKAAAGILWLKLNSIRFYGIADCEPRCIPSLQTAIWWCSSQFYKACAGACARPGGRQL